MYKGLSQHLSEIIELVSNLLLSFATSIAICHVALDRVHTSYHMKDLICLATTFVLIYCWASIIYKRFFRFVTTVKPV